jgi:hypothetical protein
MKRRNLIFDSLIIGLALLCLCGLLHVWRKKPLRLELTCTTAEVEQGAVFDAMSYVEVYEAGKGVLELPVIRTEKPGRQVAVYRVAEGDQSIEKILNVVVVAADQRS